jgi:hypothetical protein
MKKSLFTILTLVACCAIFAGCIKNQPYVTTINPAMTATVGTSYKFVAKFTQPATVDTLTTDSAYTLLITGYSSDPAGPKDKIVLRVSRFKGTTGLFSIVMGEAGAEYYHGSSKGTAVGGIVNISKINVYDMSGYFSFNTDDGIAITNGEFIVGLP